MNSKPPAIGRFIDPTVGLLEGEGAQQQITGADRRLEQYGPEPYALVPSDLEAIREEPTYYGRPAIKEPVWIWAVPVYLFVGGAAGSAMVLGAAAQPFDRELARKCHWVGAIGGGIGTALLIYDLGRPERFLYMLRVFRPTSPMSIGSWLLATAAPFSMGAAVLTHAPSLFKRLGTWLGYTAGILGVPLTGYTAVLLGSTAVPIWQQTRRSLPFLFVGSAMLGMTSIFQFLRLDRRERAAILRFGMVGAAIETGASRMFRRELNQVRQVARPLDTGVPAVLWKAARLMTLAGFALSLWPGNSRGRRIAAGALGVLGGIGLRFAVFEAGKQSSHDPRATFRQQRFGLGAREVTGRSAVAGPGE